MNGLKPIEPQLPQDGPPPGRCEYCGAVLNPFFYFCAGCGTPYKPFESVVTAASPPPMSDAEMIQRKAPDVAPLFWTYFSVAIFSGLVSYLLFVEKRPELALFVQIGVLLVTTLIFAAIYWKSLASQLVRIGFGHVEAWIALVILPGMLLVNFVYHRLFLMKLLKVKEAFSLDQLREAGISEPTLILIFCIYPAIAEEIAFRGLLQHWLHTALSPWKAVGLAAFLFAVLHFSVLSLPYLFGVGVLLGWAKWKTGSLYPSMLIHFLHNLVAIEFI